MKCPYCGAEVNGSVCEYCDSQMPIDLLKDYGLMDSDGNEIQKDFNSSDTVLSLCRDFIGKYEGAADEFTIIAQGQHQGRHINPRLWKTLKVDPAQETIFLAHDDTMLHSGKNGFALTSTGIHDLELLDRTPAFTSWDELIRAEELTMQTVSVLAGERHLTYFSGSDKFQKALLQLMKTIQQLLKTYGLDHLE